jgi:hypothetical protein
MHPKTNRQSEYVKTNAPIAKFKNNPVSTILSQTGYNIEDLAAVAGLEYYKTKSIVNGVTLPTKDEMNLLDLAFQIPLGTLFLKYNATNI